MECLTVGSATILADCYNANPGSMANEPGNIIADAKQEKKKSGLYLRADG
jgi:UDP-N-acetylmuramyl pentapeptide synthase